MAYAHIRATAGRLYNSHQTVSLPSGTLSRFRTIGRFYSGLTKGARDATIVVLSVVLQHEGFFSGFHFAQGALR
jgi:hypothetical protein